MAIGDPPVVATVPAPYYNDHTWPTYPPALTHSTSTPSRTTTRQTVTTVREFDAKGKVVKETVTEETVTESGSTWGVTF